MLKVTSDGGRFDLTQFAKALHDEALKVGLQELEARARGAASSIVDPETGKHAQVFVRKKSEAELVICTHGSQVFARELERRLGMTMGSIESKNTAAGPDVPRLYLAHASEDHEPLARPLALRLMANGIAVWFDEWEIRTGDSLRRKMEEGLTDCTHFLVLLTPWSLSKPWVRSEIDVGFVRAIGGQSRFLGLRIGTEVGDLSPFLQTLRCPAIDLGSDTEVEGLIADIHGISRKPERGPAPKYVSTVPEALAGWSKSAVAVAEYLVLNSKLGRKFDPQVLLADLAKTLGLPEEDVRLGALDLSEAGLIEKSREIGSQRYWPLPGLFVEFDRHFLNFDNEKDAIALANWLISQNIRDLKIEDLAPNFSGWEPRRLNSALAYLEEAKLIDATKTINSGPWLVYRLRVTDHTRRFVRDHG